MTVKQTYRIIIDTVMRYFDDGQEIEALKGAVAILTQDLMPADAETFDIVITGVKVTESEGENEDIQN